MNEEHETDILLRDANCRIFLKNSYLYIGSVFNGIVSNSGYIDYEFYDIKVLFEI